MVDYYDKKSATITDVFLNSLYAEFDFIVANPELFQVKYRQTRVRYIRGFPYGIHYILKEQTIEMLAVLHTSRDPEIWKKR